MTTCDFDENPFSNVLTVALRQIQIIIRAATSRGVPNYDSALVAGCRDARVRRRRGRST